MINRCCRYNLVTGMLLNLSKHNVWENLTILLAFRPRRMTLNAIENNPVHSALPTHGFEPMSPAVARMNKRVVDPVWPKN